MHVLTMQHSRRFGPDMGGPSKGRGKGRGRGRGRRHVEPPIVKTKELNAWFAGNLPDDWFTEAPDVTFDRDEILVTGTLAMPKLGSEDDSEVAARARIAAFREQSREQRMTIAELAQGLYLRKVSWAVRCGTEETAFTTSSVPVMTRLGMEERATLDTLIEAGVARSRSEALAWCVQLVADNENDWITNLRDAMEDVVKVRDAGPGSAD